ncbi:MAG: polysaccharide biosynthesis tyrosine autokinase [Deltaproteobacteria bacterium]|nr:MAG: polysaccharide biosynthesis tyrosine autokinase [Deltaproteobacteria bacterium]
MSLNPAPTLAERFSLMDLLPMLRKHWWLVGVALVFSFLIAGAVLVVSPRIYRATASVLIYPSQQQEVPGRGIQPPEAHGFQEIERFYRTQVQLFQSRSFAGRVAVEYNQVTGDELSPRDILDRMTVVPVERSHLMRISMTDQEPERAQLLADLVARAFVDENLERRRALAREANRWIEERLADAARRREVAFAELIAFKDEHNLIQGHRDGRDDRDGGTLSSMLEELEQEYGRLTAQRVLLEARVDTLTELLGRKDIDALLRMPGLPISREITRAYEAARAAASTARASYGERHPDYIQANAALREIEEQVASETALAVRAEQKNLALMRQQERQLVSEREKAKAEVLQAERLAAQYRELERELRQIERNHQQLVDRRDELQRVSETRLNNAYNVDKATAPEQPIRPRVLLTLLAAGLLGGFLGLLAVVARGLTDESISGPADIEPYIRVPILAVLPNISGSREKIELTPQFEPTSMLSEAIRGLCTMAGRTRDGLNARHILVTSSLSSEGKTSIAVQIGVTFAQSGKSVLLVEGDHRRPRLHQVFDVARNRPGLNNILLDNAPMDSVVTETMVPRLRLLTRGSHTGRTWEVLASPAMQEFISMAEESYDLIVIDTPPAGGLADPVHLGRHVDNIILVVKAGSSSRSLVRFTLNKFEKAGCDVTGLVLNASRSRDSGDPYYYYGYGKYAYGSDDKEAEPPARMSS